MIALASDHAGFELKNKIAAYFEELGLEFKDFGTFSDESCDYPDYARLAANAVVSGECEKGVLVCGTGMGISIAANKVKGIRCAACSEPFSAMLSRQHNDSNMLAFGSRVIGEGMARMIVKTWLGAEFMGDRHAARVEKIHDIEDS